MPDQIKLQKEIYLTQQLVVPIMLLLTKEVSKKEKKSKSLYIFYEVLVIDMYICII